VETVYGLTSLDHRDADPRLLASWIRSHWTIKNREDEGAGAGTPLLIGWLQHLQNITPPVPALNPRSDAPHTTLRQPWPPPAIAVHQDEARWVKAADVVRHRGRR
jgi:hypothetical protein